MTPLSKDKIDEILELTDGESSILIELFQSFLKDAKELSEGIKDAASNSDWEKLKFDVHSLKGLCGTIGATKLFDVCEVLNDDLKNNNKTTAITLADEAFVEYKELVKFITSTYQV